ncbi:hypothetical protein BGZ46_008395, partial [Entomortierella lignicola]
MSLLSPSSYISSSSSSSKRTVLDEPNISEDYELALQILMQDVEDLITKGKSSSNSELLFRDEIHAALTSIADYKMAHSLNHAQQQDAEILDPVMDDEYQVLSDRMFAMALSTEDSTGESEASTSGNSKLMTVGNIKTTTASGKTKSLNVMGSTSEHSAGGSLTHLKSFGECICCYDRKNVFRLGCKHLYCAECLANLFKSASKDETLLPVSCCEQEMPVDLIAPTILTPTECTRLNAAIRENKSVDRVYCSNKSCSRFLGPAAEAPVLHCKRCHTATCTSCKEGSHTGACKEDEQSQLVLQIAKENKWQTCPRCHYIIELNTGCYHITCRCRYEFCYLCSKKWKNCRCDLWDETRLIEAAQRRVEHHHPNADVRARVQLVEQMATRMRGTECIHRFDKDSTLRMRP